MNEKKKSVRQFENEILAHEQSMWKRWSAGDPTGFAESFHNDATLFRWQEVQTFARLDGKEEIQEYLNTFIENIPAHKYKMVDPRIQVLGETAIMTFEYHVFMNENELAGRWKATDVYQWFDGDLKIIHSHWSVVE